MKLRGELGGPDMAVYQPRRLHLILAHTRGTNKVTACCHGRIGWPIQLGRSYSGSK